MTKELYLSALKRTGNDCMQLLGTMGALALTFAISSGLAALGNFNVFAFLVGAASVFVKPRLWLHGPLALFAIVAATIVGGNEIPWHLIWALGFFVALYIKHFGEVSSTDTYSQLGILLMFLCTAAFLVPLV